MVPWHGRGQEFNSPFERSTDDLTDTRLDAPGEPLRAFGSRTSTRRPGGHSWHGRGQEFNSPKLHNDADRVSVQSHWASTIGNEFDRPVIAGSRALGRSVSRWTRVSSAGPALSRCLLSMLTPESHPSDDPA